MSAIFPKYDPKQCSRCDKNFICTGNSNCPCLDIQIPEKLLDYIADHFDGCLCPDCIEQLKIDDFKLLF
jgi:hypothetical protein